MKLVLAYNPLSDIKVWAVNRVLKPNGKPLVQDASGLSGLASSDPVLFGKCTKFFGNFRKCFEELVPVPAKFGQYNQIYNGAMADLGKSEDSRNGFFGDRFDLDKVNESTGEYAGFKNDCGTTSLVGHLNDVLGSLTNSTFRDAMNKDQAFRKSVNAEIQKFSSGAVGIEQFYQDINVLVNSMESNTGVTFQRKTGKGDAWSSIGSPVMSKGKYTCYCVRKWEDLNAVAGFTNWCVAQDGKSGRDFFDGDGDEKSGKAYIHPNYDNEGNPTQYVNDKKNAYYLICNGKTPVALFNVSTRKSDRQFKNTGDDPIKIDRPSSNDLIPIGNELRKMLGVSDDYDDDFEVFRDFEQQSGWKDDQKAVDFNDPNERRRLIDELNKGYGREVIEKDPSLLEDDDIRNAFVKRCLNQGFGYDVLYNDLSLLNYSDIRQAFVNECLSKGHGYGALEKHPSLLNNDDIRKAFVKCLKKGFGYGALEKHPSLLNNDDIRKAFVDGLKKGSGYYVLKSNPSLLNNDDIRKAFVENLKNQAFGYGILADKPSLLNDSDIRNTFVNECLRIGHGYQSLEDNPSLLEDDDIRKAFVNGCLSTGHGYEVIEKDPSLLNDDNIRQTFLDGCLNKGYGYGVFESNPSLLNDDDIRQAFVNECLNKRNGYGVLEKNPSLLNNDDIRQAFVNGLNKRNGSDVLKLNPSLIDTHDDIRETVFNLARNKKISLGPLAGSNTVSEMFLKSKEISEKDAFDICGGTRNAKLIEHVLNMFSNSGDMRVGVLRNKNVDENRLYSICKSFAHKDYHFLKEFIKRFMDSHKNDKDFWDYVLGSNYTFEVIRDFHESIPDNYIEQFANSNDEDVRWIANKHVKSISEKRASRIARRLYLLETIPYRIMRRSLQNRISCAMGGGTRVNESFRRRSS